MASESNWSDKKKWLMGILSALIVTIVIALFGYLRDSGKASDLESSPPPIDRSSTPTVTETTTVPPLPAATPAPTATPPPSGGEEENPGTSQSDPTKPSEIEESKVLLPHDLDVFKATASTAKQEPMNVLDGNVSLSTWTSRWISADRETEGAWLELNLPEPATVTGVRIFMVIKERFAGGQIRDAELLFSDNSSQAVRFPFKPGWQQVDIQPVRTDLVRIVVKSVYPGQEEGFGVDVFEVGLVGN